MASVIRVVILLTLLLAWGGDNLVWVSSPTPSYVVKGKVFHGFCHSRRPIALTSSSVIERKQWITKLLGSRINPGLSGGWRKFATDNHLEEGDVCVFELTDSTHLQLMVHIYRVVDLDEMQKEDIAHLPQKCHLIGTGKMRGAICEDSMKSDITAKTNSLPTSVHDHQLLRKKPMKNGKLCGIEVEVCQHLKSMLLQKKVKAEETLQPFIVKAEPFDSAEMQLATVKTNEMQNQLDKKLHDDFKKSQHKDTAANICTKCEDEREDHC
ncbi:hypothetical protein L7F22_059397 [Adiantum nelumboides]|nr:hypothetical protein [Adiantum nelumboides]